MGAGKRFPCVMSLLLLLGMVTGAAAAPITINFDGLSSDGRVLLEQGFVLDPGARDWSPDAQGWIGHYHIATPGAGWLADNGTNFMVVDYFLDNTTLNVYSTSGAAFGLQSLDLAEALIPGESSCSASLPPYRVAFTGYLAGGGTLSRSVTLDMVCDGAGPQIDFERFAFDSGWGNLVMLTIAQLTMGDTPFSNLGIDNLALQTVPEPDSIALVALALVATGLVRRRRYKASTGVG